MLESLYIAVLKSTSKNALSSLLGLCLFFNKISDKGRKIPAWNRGEEGGDGRGGRQEGEMTQTMYAQVNI
jgi:hypothetical protein